MVIERPVSGFNAWSDGGRRKLSKGAVIAIGASLAVHLVGGLYVFYLRIAPPKIEQAPEPTAILVDTLRVTPVTRTPREHPPVVAKIHDPDQKAPIVTTTLDAPPQHIDTAQPDQPPVIADKTLTKAAPDLSTPPKAHIIANPTWVRRPTPDELSQFYPPRALDEGVSGQAVLDCSVTAQGALVQCTTSGETPRGQGFAAAALKASRIFRMTPRAEDGQAVEGGTVHIPIHFQTRD